jgi:integrase
VLLAVFCSLRWGELAALRRHHIDLASSTVRIQESVVELIDGSLVTGPPKSLAGRRVVSIPAALQPDILRHLEDFTASGDDALIFTGTKNAQLRRSNFSKAWRDATEAASLTAFHLHDLRHTGNTLASASLRELMERMGHSTTRAALIYQRTSERDKLIADAMGKLAKAELRQRGRPSGTQRARKGKRAS